MSESIQSAIFTIGHSTHPQERFIDLLKEHAITAVCDVRSAPYSQFNPQFNREELGKVLPRQGIRYLFLERTRRAKRRSRLLRTGQSAVQPYCAN